MLLNKQSLRVELSRMRAGKPALSGVGPDWLAWLATFWVLGRSLLTILKRCDYFTFFSQLFRNFANGNSLTII